MKRTLSCLVVLIASTFSCGDVLAGEPGKTPASVAQQPPPFKIGSHFSRSVQKWTGINAATSFVASGIGTLIVRHELGGKSHVKVRTYSLTDLLAGKIQSVDVEVKDSSYKGIPLGDLRFQSATPMWVSAFSTRAQRAGLRNAVLVKVDGSITNDELSRALANPKLSHSMRMVKVQLPGMGEQRLQFLKPSVDLEDGKIALNSTLITEGAPPDTGVSVSVVGTPYLDGSRVAVKDLKFDSPDIMSPDDFSRFVQPLVNPLVDLAKLDRSTHAFRLSDLSVSDGKAEFNGNLVLAPRAARKQVAAGTTKTK